MTAVTAEPSFGCRSSKAAPHTDSPELTQLAVAQNRVDLCFTLHEHGGVWIESQRQGDTAAPYVDTRAVKVPGTLEWRDYRACWWDDATPTMNFRAGAKGAGQWVSVTVETILFSKACQNP